MELGKETIRSRGLDRIEFSTLDRKSDRANDPVCVRTTMETPLGLDLNQESFFVSLPRVSDTVYKYVMKIISY